MSTEEAAASSGQEHALSTRPEDHTNDRLEFGSGLRIFLARREEAEASPVVYPFPPSPPSAPAEPARQHPPEASREPPVAGDPHEVLARHAEEQADALWQIFRDALAATTPSGRPDHRTRLLAARTLLTEVARVRGPIGGRTPRVKDQLAELRRRRTAT